MGSGRSRKVLARFWFQLEVHLTVFELIRLVQLVQWCIEIIEWGRKNGNKRGEDKQLADPRREVNPPGPSWPGPRLPGWRLPRWPSPRR